MAEKEDGKCTSVGGLAVKLGLYKKPEHPDGLIAWDGGECPVEFRQPVKVRFRAGVVSDTVDAGLMRWTHGTAGVPDCDIVAYRLVQPAPVTDWVEVVTR